MSTSSNQCCYFNLLGLLVLSTLSRPMCTLLSYFCPSVCLSCLAASTSRIGPFLLTPVTIICFVPCSRTPLAYSLRSATTSTEQSERPRRLVFTSIYVLSGDRHFVVVQYFGLRDLTFYGADDIGLQGLRRRIVLVNVWHSCASLLAALGLRLYKNVLG